MLVGTSMGGARPKAVVEDDDGLWIAKFNRPDDRWNYANVEHAMLVLARICGISVAESSIVRSEAATSCLYSGSTASKPKGIYARAHDERLDPAAGRRKRARSLVLRFAGRGIAPLVLTLRRMRPSFSGACASTR